MIEQNPAAGVQPIGLTVVDRQPMGEDLGATIRRTRPQRSRFLLGHFLHLPEHLGRGSLVVTYFFHQPCFANRFQDSYGAQAGNVSGILGHVKGNADMALGSQVVNFIRLQLVEQLDHLNGIRQVPVMQVESSIIQQGVLVKMIQTTCIESRCPSHDPMHLAPLFQKELS